MESPGPLIDIGVNLTHRSFHTDLEQVLERAEASGVVQMVLTGTSVAGSQAAADLARSRSGRLFSTAGVHPHGAKSCDDSTLPALSDLAGRAEVVAIGECGLDYNRDFSPRPVQDAWFERQLGLAIELDLPVFLHERDAHARFVEILRAAGDRLPRRVVHCFTGSADELETYLAMDCHVGITGWICDERRGAHLKEIVGRIPLDRLMIETDAPFLLPRTIAPRPRHRRNEPAFLPWVLRAVAEARGADETELAAATSRTARAFFGLPAVDGDLDAADL